MFLRTPKLSNCFIYCIHDSGPKAYPQRMMLSFLYLYLSPSTNIYSMPICQQKKILRDRHLISKIIKSTRLRRRGTQAFKQVFFTIKTSLIGSFTESFIDIKFYTTSAILFLASRIFLALCDLAWMIVPFYWRCCAGLLHCCCLVGWSVEVALCFCVANESTTKHRNLFDLLPTTPYYAGMHGNTHWN